MSFEYEERERDIEAFMHLARHELGHHVMARIVGFKVGDFKMGREMLQRYGAGGYSSTNTMQPLRTADEIAGFARYRIKVAFAGVLAGEMENGVVNEDRSANQLDHGGGLDDRTKAIENVQLLRNILHPETTDVAQAQKEVDALYFGLWADCIAIISAEGPMIEKVSADLVARKLKLGERPLVLTAEELAELPLLKARFG